MNDDNRPDLTLIQLSDTHIMPEGQLLHGTVDTMANLVAAVEAVEASGLPVAAFVLSGDLTDSGKAAAYRRLRSVVEPAAARLGAEVVYAPGNHDERAAFRSELLDERPSTAEYDVVRMIGGLRVVVLDSTEPGRHDGHVSRSQLDWLADVLAEPAPLGSLLVTHHPPLPSPSRRCTCCGCARPTGWPPYWRAPTYGWWSPGTRTTPDAVRCPGSRCGSGPRRPTA